MVESDQMVGTGTGSVGWRVVGCGKRVEGLGTGVGVQGAFQLVVN